MPAAWPWRWLFDGREPTTSQIPPTSTAQFQLVPQLPSPLFKENCYQHKELKDSAAAPEKGWGGWWEDGTSGTHFWGNWSSSAPHVTGSWRKPSNLISVWRRSCYGRTKRFTSSVGLSLHWSGRMLISGRTLFFKINEWGWNQRMDRLLEEQSDNSGWYLSGGGQRRPGRLWGWGLRGFGSSRNRLSLCRSSSPGLPSWRLNYISTGTRIVCGHKQACLCTYLHSICLCALLIVFKLHLNWIIGLKLSAKCVNIYSLCLNIHSDLIHSFTIQIVPSYILVFEI